MNADNGAMRRNYQLDNVRAILIYLVVLGHLIPTYGGGMRGPLFNFIYTFHMAVFVFTSGYYARFDRKKIFKHYLWPYIFFQTAYYYFNTYVLNIDSSFQFTTPQFTLWYLLTVATYCCLIPLFQVKNRKQAVMAVAISFVAALLVGLDDTIGPYLSLSRTIAFLPFFLLGLYREILIDEKTDRKLKDNRLLVAAVVMIVGLEFIICLSDLRASVLMLDGEYADISLLPIRLAAEVLGFLWTFVMFRLVPKKKIRILTTVGQNTMPVYLLHGFIAKAITHFHVLHFGTGINELIAAFIAMAIVLLFGNAIFGKAMRKIF